MLLLALACASRVPVTTYEDFDETFEIEHSGGLELAVSVAEGTDPPLLEIELTETITTEVWTRRETTTTQKHVPNGKLLHGYWWTAGAFMSHGLLLAAADDPGERVGTQVLVWGTGLAFMGGAVAWTIAPALPGRDAVTVPDQGPLVETRERIEPQAGAPLRLVMGDKEIGAVTTDATGHASWTFPDKKLYGFRWDLKVVDGAGNITQIDLRDSTEIGLWLGELARNGRSIDRDQKFAIEPTDAAYAAYWAGSCDRKLEHLGAFDTPQDLFRWLPEESKVVPECQAVFDALPEHAIEKVAWALELGEHRSARAWAELAPGDVKLDLVTQVNEEKSADVASTWGPRKREAFAVCRSFHSGLARVEGKVNTAQRSGDQDRFDAAVNEARDWMSENQGPMQDAMEDLSLIARQMERQDLDPTSFIYEVARNCDR
ncbi:MAG: hypothetical protein GY884_33680 [Proteobacteria bacterium]|nr:hypothetical protein [Pseudomonadota bacterium]